MDKRFSTIALAVIATGLISHFSSLATGGAYYTSPTTQQAQTTAQDDPGALLDPQEGSRAWEKEKQEVEKKAREAEEQVLAEQRAQAEARKQQWREEQQKAEEVWEDEKPKQYADIMTDTSTEKSKDNDALGHEVMPPQDPEKEPVNPLTEPMETMQDKQQSQDGQSEVPPKGKVPKEQDKEDIIDQAQHDALGTDYGKE